MRQLLIDLIATLKQIDPKKFDLTSWLNKDSGCAMSYGLSIDSWKAAGMESAVATGGICPYFDGEFGGYAISAFLQIPYQKVKELFFPSSYPEFKGAKALELVIERLEREIA